MAGAPLNPTYAPLYVAAGAKYKIPPAVLAGVADVETNGGQNIAVSSTGAEGLMQFEPGTAAGLGINPNVPAQAVDGAARLLNQYGYQTNPTRALAAYNAGPGNYTAGLGYARQVLSSAARLAPALTGFGAGSTSTPTAQTVPGAPGSSSTSSYGGLSGWLLKATLTVTFVGGGLVLAAEGLRSIFGGTPHPHPRMPAAAVGRAGGGTASKTTELEEAAAA